MHFIPIFIPVIILYKYKWYKNINHLIILICQNKINLVSNIINIQKKKKKKVNYKTIYLYR